MNYDSIALIFLKELIFLLNDNQVTFGTYYS